VLTFAYETGLIRAGRGLWAKSLTVVNYHRIDDPYRKENLTSARRPRILIASLRICVDGSTWFR
jgi:hypothetical protein